jgi:YesN/AraC family two-component response regulator
MAREHHPDILVLDINMPRIDGLAAFKEINRIQPGTGCVIVTGQRETGPLDMAMTLGVYEYLLKPFNIEELNNAVNRVAAQLVEKRIKFAGEIEQLKNEAAQLAPSQLEAPAEYNEEEQLKTLAAEYAKTRRTDDEALAVFDKLAQNPACELRWLRTLAMLYVIRQDWDKLQTLSARLYQQAGRQVK